MFRVLAVQMIDAQVNHSDLMKRQPARSRLRISSILLAIALQYPSPGAAGTPANEAIEGLEYWNGIGSIPLIDQDGRAATLAAQKGRLVVLNFVFTGCGAVCPTQTHELAQIQQQLPSTTRARIQFVSITVDPFGDTPAALKAFATAHGADLGNWSFLTGNPVDIDRLHDALDLRPPNASSVQSHSTDIRVFDRRGRLMQRYGGIQIDKARLSKEIQLLVERD